MASDSKVHLFDEQILQDLSESADQSSMIKDHFKLRPLAKSDYEHGFMQTLSQLTTVGDVSQEQFNETFDKMKQNGSYYIIVVEDTLTNKIAGSSTLFLEYKFIHNCGLRGRIEDVVVNDEYRGQKLGIRMIQTLKSLAKKLNCYKLTLDCNDNMIEWYRKYFDFQLESGRSNFMTIRFS